MLQRQIPVEHAGPLLVSSVSGLYIIARARRLALAEPTDAPLSRFLMRQSDVILMLCGGPAIWYVTHNRKLRKLRAGSSEMVRGAPARAIHQLRQVFTALLLGTSLLARKAAAGKTSEIVALATRLNAIVRDGMEALKVLGEPYPSDLLDEHGNPIGDGAELGGMTS